MDVTPCCPLSLDPLKLLYFGGLHKYYAHLYGARGGPNHHSANY
jgi:hypothetical protein